MRIVALLAVRNEEHYLERCLMYLYDQGIETCRLQLGEIGVIRLDMRPCNIRPVTRFNSEWININICCAPGGINQPQKLPFGCL